MANAYETLLVFSVKGAEEDVAAKVEAAKALIGSFGTVDNVDDWGKRRLAYPINYENEGYYIIVNHSSEPESIYQIARKLNITDGVLRYLTTAKEAK